MNWFAIRTAPGAQRPKREYWTEKAPGSRKGYRVISGTSPESSAVEIALAEAGFTHYMPAEFTAVRNRHKVGVYELARFALLKGYMFVSDVTDAEWPRLKAVPGVLGVVANDKRPFLISTLDLHQLRMYEAHSRDAAVDRVKTLSAREDRSARETRKMALRGARKKLFSGREVKLIWGQKTGHDATVQAWEDQDRVRVLLKSLNDARETLVIPYEFLKVAS